MNAFNVSMLGILAFAWGVAVWVCLWHVGWIQTLRSEWTCWRMRAKRRRWARKLRDLDARTGEEG